MTGRMTNAFALNPLCMDALREVGNIGLGNAMTVLATLLDQNVNMGVPDVSVISLAQFAHIAGGDEAVSACIYMPVEGDAPGRVALFLPLDAARHLADCVLGLEAGTTQSFDEVADSALMEIGNILASTYLAAIGDMTGLSLLSSPPALAIDMTAAILASIAGTLDEDEERALTIVTGIGDPDGALNGFFLYVPDQASIGTLLNALGLEDEMPTHAGALPAASLAGIPMLPAALPAAPLICAAAALGPACSENMLSGQGAR